MSETRAPSSRRTQSALKRTRAERAGSKSLASAVRVQLLLDDKGITGLDFELLALDDLANLKVRLVNPLTLSRLRLLSFTFGVQIVPTVEPKTTWLDQTLVKIINVLPVEWMM